MILVQAPFCRHFRHHGQLSCTRGWDRLSNRLCALNFIRDTVWVVGTPNVIPHVSKAREKHAPHQHDSFLY